MASQGISLPLPFSQVTRSEERRVGEEWRLEFRRVLFRSPPILEPARAWSRIGVIRLGASYGFAGHLAPAPVQSGNEIGRASCRGRVEIGVQTCPLPISADSGTGACVVANRGNSPWGELWLRRASRSRSSSVR